MDPLPVTGQAPAAPARSAPEMSASPRPPVAAAALLAAATVGAQIAYPLLDGGALRAATVATVLLFAAASLTHAAARWGTVAALRLLAVAGGLGLLAEAVGVATGVPFGEYRYTGTLGPALLGVPVVVPLAWTMMAYPCLLLGRRLGGTRVRTAVLGAAALAAWDLSLDPQMVAAGHWVWSHPQPDLPGVPGIPLTNFAGWVVVSLVIVAALDAGLPADREARAGEAVPALLLAWTWLGSLVGNVVFFGRPAVGLWVGVALGATVVPYLLAWRRSAR